MVLLKNIACECFSFLLYGTQIAELFYVNLQILFKFINRWYVQELKQHWVMQEAMNFLVLFSLKWQWNSKSLLVQGSSKENIPCKCFL